MMMKNKIRRAFNQNQNETLIKSPSNFGMDGTKSYETKKIKASYSRYVNYKYNPCYQTNKYCSCARNMARQQSLDHPC